MVYPHETLSSLNEARSWAGANGVRIALLLRELSHSSPWSCRPELNAAGQQLIGSVQPIESQST